MRILCRGVLLDASTATLPPHKHHVCHESVHSLSTLLENEYGLLAPSVGLGSRKFLNVRIDALWRRRVQSRFPMAK
jgi:hypothetical protein